MFNNRILHAKEHLLYEDCNHKLTAINKQEIKLYTLFEICSNMYGQDLEIR